MRVRRDFRPDPTCDRHGCPAPPTSQLRLRFFAPNSDKSFLCEIGIFLCEPHGKEEKVERWLTDNMKSTTTIACRQQRRVVPDWSRTKLELIPILNI